MPTPAGGLSDMKLITHSYSVLAGLKIALLHPHFTRITAVRIGTVAMNTNKPQPPPHVLLSSR